MKENRYCRECFEDIKNEHDIIEHAKRHMVGTDKLAVKYTHKDPRASWNLPK